MNKKANQVLDIVIRYAILIAVAIPNLWLFYFIFTPITIYPVNFLLKLFYQTSLTGSLITVSSCFPIEIISSCVAGSAYYLLLILNLSTPGIKLKKRINLLLLSFASFLALNILRIFLLSLLFISGSIWFDVTHKLFWYLLSTVFVVGIWFLEVKLFKIKKIPFYSDLKMAYKLN